MEKKERKKTMRRVGDNGHVHGTCFSALLMYSIPKIYRVVKYASMQEISV